MQGGIPPADSFVKLCRVIQKAFSEIPSRSPHLPVQVGDWSKIIAARLSKEDAPYVIDMGPIPTPSITAYSKQIYGSLSRYTGGAGIRVLDTETYCWQRYIAAKELAHLLIDEPQHYTINPGNLIAQLLSGIPLHYLRKDQDQDDRSFESETQAMVAAIEMLLPWAHRSALQSLVDKGQTPLELAQTFKVPRRVVSTMLAPHYWPASQAANVEAEKS